MKTESDLSEADLKALRFIRAYMTERGQVPSYTEIGEHLKLPFANNAKRNCDRLVAGGFLPRGQVGTRSPGRPRALQLAPLRDLVFPYRGDVSCGPGQPPEDGDEEIDLREFLKSGAAAVFRARGNSMAEAKIADGDLLLVTEDPDPPEGSIVIAIMGDRMLCKRLARKSRNGVLLEACNDEAESFVVDTELVEFRVMGVLKNVLRKL